MNDRLRMLQRQPRRITITLSYHVHEALLSRSEEEGRSVSNLCAFLLEESLRHPAILPLAQASAAAPEGMVVTPSHAFEKKVCGNGHLSGA